MSSFKSNKGYYMVLLLTLSCFVSLVWIMASNPNITYFASTAMTLLFIIFSIVNLFLVSKNPRYGWSFSIFFFLMNVFNSFYIFIFEASLVLLIYSLSSIAGLILSIYNVDSSVRGKFKKLRNATRQKAKRTKDSLKRKFT